MTRLFFADVEYATHGISIMKTACLQKICHRFILSDDDSCNPLKLDNDIFTCPRPALPYVQYNT
jgi:hypothetical protein